MAKHTSRKAPPHPKFRDRIIDLRRVPASSLRPNPKNWRTHPDDQVGAVSGILSQIGIVDALLVRETTTGLEIIDGHLRADVCGDELVPVLVLDVNESEAEHILATFDPTGDMAGIDRAKLDELLRSVNFGSDDVQGMLAGLAEEAGIVPAGEEPKLKDVDTREPPPLTWVLVGMPTVKFGRIAELVEKISADPDAIVKTTVTNEIDEN